jgi:hypothetical protein
MPSSPGTDTLCVLNRNMGWGWLLILTSCIWALWQGKPWQFSEYFVGKLKMGIKCPGICLKLLCHWIDVTFVLYSFTILYWTLWYAGFSAKFLESEINKYG